jgi:hypothetical protein
MKKTNPPARLHGRRVIGGPGQPRYGHAGWMRPPTTGAKRRERGAGRGYPLPTCLEDIEFPFGTLPM